MTKVLQSSWGVALVGGLCYLMTTVLLWRAPVLPRVPRANMAAAARTRAVPSWQFHNPEIDLLVVELKSEKQELKTQRERLEAWAARLQAERTELNTVTQLVQQMQKELDTTVVRIKDEERDNLRRLAKVYAAMTPEGAVKILAEVEEEQVVKLFTTMKEAETAPVLEQMGKEPGQAKRAARITERLRLVLQRGATGAKAKSP